MKIRSGEGAAYAAHEGTNHAEDDTANSQGTAAGTEDGGAGTNRRSTVQIAEVKTNAPVDEARFTKPAEAAR
jgi:hypothetical protein